MILVSAGSSRAAESFINPSQQIEDDLSVARALRHSKEDMIPDLFDQLRRLFGKQQPWGAEADQEIGKACTDRAHQSGSPAGHGANQDCLNCKTHAQAAGPKSELR